MKRLVMVLVLCSVLSLALVPSLAAESPQDFNPPCFHVQLYPYEVSVDAGGVVDIPCDITVFELGELKIEIYGDVVQTEGWGFQLMLAPSLTLNRLYDFPVRVATNADAYNKDYGFIIMGYWNGVYTFAAEVWVKVASGRPYAESQPRFNHTGAICGENIPRDVYLPSRNFPITAWFKVEEAGLYYVDLYPTTTDYPIYMEPGSEYNFSVTYYPGPIGGVDPIVIRLKRSEGLGDVVEEMWVNIAKHCPGGENPPPPITDYSALGLPDLNLDGDVDIFDLVLIAGAYGSTPEDPEWNVLADLNANYVVDIFDLVILAGAYGTET